MASPYIIGLTPSGLTALRLTAVGLRPYLYYRASPSHSSLGEQESVCFANTDLKGCVNIAITRFKSNPPELCQSYQSVRVHVTVTAMLRFQAISIRLKMCKCQSSKFLNILLAVKKVMNITDQIKSFYLTARWETHAKKCCFRKLAKCCRMPSISCVVLHPYRQVKFSFIPLFFPKNLFSLKFPTLRLHTLTILNVD